MDDWQRKMGVLYPLGVTPVEGGVKILVRAKAETCSLLLFRKGEKAPCETLAFSEKERVGDVWSMNLLGRNPEALEYSFEADGKPLFDGYARAVSGREKWGDLNRVGKSVRSRFVAEEFCWEGDQPLEIPLGDTVIYRLHVRGFTKHASSGVSARGTFSGVAEKIPYLKDLGVTAVELMMPVEFEEIMMPEEMDGNPYGKKGPTGVINYWGYGPANLFAPKAAYGAGKGADASGELKELVKRLHKNGLECIVELYFTGEESPQLILDSLRYWVQEYHVDGIHVTGFVRAGMIADDAFLGRTKLFADSWQEWKEKPERDRQGGAAAGKETIREKHLAECGRRFETDMRRLLKGDEEQMNALIFHSKNNPAGCGVVNYMANTNGFTMMDMVSYDTKHNEKNGEENRDGDSYNYSWNCGVEGPTRKKKILELRKRQLRNAFLMLFLSQGTPLFLAGDEFGNSQEGNNNAYCQDNEISWLNWKQEKSNADLLGFVKNAIAFRKKHPVFHMDREPRVMDYKSCGRPDMSFHGENVWKPELENFRRQLGILYWGPYGIREDGSADDTFYVAYNMHWEPHVFGMPHLAKGQLWHVAFDTSDEKGGFYPEGQEPVLKDQKQTVIPPRSIVVFCSKEGSGYFTYETPIGGVTVCCRDESVTGIHFGRVIPDEPDMKEARTELSDKVYSQLTEYFSGARKEFDLPLALSGTAFQKKVWAALQTIPYGETRSYKEIAAQVGDEKACRAVGMANNRNPAAIVVPCHRVIGADGSMVGYGGGTEIKKKLLALEKMAAE